MSCGCASSSGMAQQSVRESREGFAGSAIGQPVPGAVPSPVLDETDDLSRSVQASSPTGAGLI